MCVPPVGDRPPPLPHTQKYTIPSQQLRTPFQQFFSVLWATSTSILKIRCNRRWRKGCFCLYVWEGGTDELHFKLFDLAIMFSLANIYPQIYVSEGISITKVQKKVDIYRHQKRSQWSDLSVNLLKNSV